MTRVKRRVRVDAVVDVEETEGPQDQGIAYAHTAMELMKAAVLRIGGSTRGYTGIDYPVTRFSIDSEPAEPASDAELDAWASGLDMAGMTDALLDFAEHLAHGANDAHVWERVMALRRRREELRSVLPELRWAPYREFGIPDPAAETHEPPATAFTVGGTGYRGDDIIVYWTAAP